MSLHAYTLRVFPVVRTCYMLVIKVIPTTHSEGCCLVLGCQSVWGRRVWCERESSLRASPDHWIPHWACPVQETVTTHADSSPACNIMWWWTYRTCTCISNCAIDYNQLGRVMLETWLNTHTHAHIYTYMWHCMHAHTHTHTHYMYWPCCQWDQCATVVCNSQRCVWHQYCCSEVQVSGAGDRKIVSQLQLCVCVCVCVCVCKRERERERERDNTCTRTLFCPYVIPISSLERSRYSTSLRAWEVAFFNSCTWGSSKKGRVNVVHYFHFSLDPRYWKGVYTEVLLYVCEFGLWTNLLMFWTWGS